MQDDDAQDDLIAAQIEAIKETVEAFREIRTRRSLDTTLFQFNEFAKENSIPEALAEQMKEAIKNPEMKIEPKFTPKTK